MQKPSRQWHEFLVDDGALFGMAAVTQRGRTADGAWFTCYSIVMRPAPEHLAGVHDRMPVLVPASFAGEWLTAGTGREVVARAAAVGMDVTAYVRDPARLGAAADGVRVETGALEQVSAHARDER